MGKPAALAALAKLRKRLRVARNLDCTDAGTGLATLCTEEIAMALPETTGTKYDIERISEG